MTHNPRPIIEWLNELPELIRELVIADYVINQEYFDGVFETLRDAIMGFRWSGSSMGESFYECLYEDALYHEQNNIKLPR